MVKKDNILIIDKYWQQIEIDLDDIDPLFVLIAQFV